MERGKDKRKHRRLPLKLIVSCQKVGLSGGQIYTGNTVNVGPGGMLIEISDCRLSDGELLGIEMSVPPTEGLLEYGGRFSSYARVIRVDTQLDGKARPASNAQTVALEFCDSPKLRL